ncbi:ComF family protein [Gilvimarinus agarilyticus]|uniref:ComF family protein n=1 Tax=unclassified Gilvimarinus TaxID=2642066 RepID=UPI001C099D06|nr:MULTISPECIES: ComF family protein [unclassified Gilvimarinus]MBU2885334.1 ComF family protein [Gilvimarinus agarilyticus]MDO6570233.1 ComF family protein [Gilvimarinus sp. 2_MG-2023]MDO6748228.1 ComF family protein [Gilvimarinus sp. 1_MG-2023]
MLFHPHCLLCHQPAHDRLCPDCHNALSELLIGQRQCQQCALPMAADTPFCGECLAKPPAFERAFIPFQYQFPLDYLIGRYKFSGCLASEKLMTELFAHFIARHAPKPDLIVPTPLHWRSHIKRGYNQSQRLATAAARGLNMHINTQILHKTRATPAQHGLKKRDRTRNLKQCFACKPLQGQVVALVDDIVTTATTARQLSKQLRRAGASQVYIWALARTPSAR